MRTEMLRGKVFLLVALLSLGAASAAVCGDGLRDSNEQCEDGNKVRAAPSLFIPRARCCMLWLSHDGLLTYAQCFSSSLGGPRRLLVVVSVRAGPLQLCHQRG